jgi:hypothetical protein
LAALAVFTATTTTATAATKSACFGQGSGDPGCRIVKVGDRFQVSSIVGTASLWLQLQFRCTSSPPALANLLFYFEGTFFSSFNGVSPCGGGSVGQLLQVPGNWVVEYRDATSGELLDTLRITLVTG